MLFQVVYILSTTVVVVGFLLSLRFYKSFKLQGVATMAWLTATALLWEQVPLEISNTMYDIAFIAVTLCLAKSKFTIKKHTEQCAYLTTGKCRLHDCETTK